MKGALSTTWRSGGRMHLTRAPGRILQRSCTCGNRSAGNGECDACR
jgi:hypothetical protein